MVQWWPSQGHGVGDLVLIGCARGLDAQAEPWRLQGHIHSGCQKEALFVFSGLPAGSRADNAIKTRYVVPCGLALATSQPSGQHDMGPGYSLSRSSGALGAACRHRCATAGWPAPCTGTPSITCSATGAKADHLYHQHRQPAGALTAALPLGCPNRHGPPGQGLHEPSGLLLSPGLRIAASPLLGQRRVPPSAARRRFTRRVSVRNGRLKGKGKEISLLATFNV
jgi:hypothetical protein